MQFHVPEMSCGHCTAAITESITALDPAAQVQTDLETRRVTVSSARPEDQIIEAIKSAGYDVSAA